MSKILRKPDCGRAGCQSRMLNGIFLSAIHYKKGVDGVLGSFCPDCRQGKGFVLDLVVTGLTGLTREEFKVFADRTGFRPRVIATKAEMAKWEKEQVGEDPVLSDILVAVTPAESESVVS